MKISTRKKSYKKILATVLIIALILGGSYVVYAKTQNTWPFRQADSKDSASKTNDTSTPNDTKTSSDKESKQINGEGNDKERNLIEKGGNKSQGQHSTAGTGITDNGGSGVTQQTGGTSSQSGNITLYSPVPNQKLTSGIKVKGATNVVKIQYRIADPIHGQIGQGVLQAHNGFFSGTLSVQGTDASSGTFEVYSFNNQGQEVNNVKIKIRY